MPPLRKRQSDLPALVADLVGRQESNGRRTLRLTQAAMDALGCYAWPGNIRELSNLVERLAILNSNGLVDLKDLPEKYRAGIALPASDTSPAVARAAPQTTHVALPSDGMDLRETLGQMERQLIRQALDSAGGTVAGAARLLKLQRTTLVEKMRKYEMSV